MKNPKVRMEAFGEINEIQKMKCPVKPMLREPSTVILSFIVDDIYDETRNLLIRKIQKYKDDLKGVYLREAHLKGANFYDAHLEGADLTDALLKGAILNNANLESANLDNAYLERALFFGTDREGADLSNALLKDARLFGANLKNAGFLSVDQLCSTGTLYLSYTDPELETQVMQQCPKKLLRAW